MLARTLEGIKTVSFHFNQHGSKCERLLSKDMNISECIY
jgi:hypothetical protein